MWIVGVAREKLYTLIVMIVHHPHHRAVEHPAHTDGLFP
jgi:hypothetical protein